MFVQKSKAQVAIEYLLLFSTVIIIFLVMLRPNGVVTEGVNRALNISFGSVAGVAESTFYNVYAEPGTCVCRTAVCLECAGT